MSYSEYQGVPFATPLGDPLGIHESTGDSSPSDLSTQPMRPAKIQPAPTTAYPTSLYRMSDVNKSLNLTPDQTTQLNKLTDQTQAQYRDSYGKLGTLIAADRYTRTQELNRQYNTAWNKGAGDIFNDTQRTRYQQFNYQYGGFNTLYEPDVQKRLNLTADQIKELRTHSDWSNEQVQDVKALGATHVTKGTQAYRDYWTTHQERFNKFLTADQQTAWRKMSGEPYAFRPTFAPQRYRSEVGA